MKVHYSSNLLSKDVFDKYFKPSFKKIYDCNLGKIDNFYNYITLEYNKIQKQKDNRLSNTINYSKIHEIGTLILLYIVNDFDIVDKQFEISFNGNTRFERLLHLIHFGDWVSLWCAYLHNTDPSPVEKIANLKNELSKF